MYRRGWAIIYAGRVWISCCCGECCRFLGSRKLYRPNSGNGIRVRNLKCIGFREVWFCERRTSSNPKECITNYYNHRRFSNLDCMRFISNRFVYRRVRASCQYLSVCASSRAEVCPASFFHSSKWPDQAEWFIGASVLCANLGDMHRRRR